MVERFTERARQVVVLAQEEARDLKHNYIGTEHLLLGLLREGDGVAARVLSALDVSLEDVRGTIMRIVGEGEHESQGQIPFTPRAKKVLELALREALSLGHNYIGTEHILLGLVRESEGVAARCRFQHGDANRLDFPDESFDAVVSNYVYHNITGADKRALLRETLRVLKKGGVFAINDNMKPRAYGDMEAFAQELRDMGYEDVRLIDTAQEAFGSRRRAAMMMLGDSRMLAGRK